MDAEKTYYFFGVPFTEEELREIALFECPYDCNIVNGKDIRKVKI